MAFKPRVDAVHPILYAGMVVPDHEPRGESIRIPSEEVTHDLPIGLFCGAVPLLSGRISVNADFDFASDTCDRIDAIGVVPLLGSGEELFASGPGVGIRQTNLLKDTDDVSVALPDDGAHGMDVEV